MSEPEHEAGAAGGARYAGAGPETEGRSAKQAPSAGTARPGEAGGQCQAPPQPGPAAAEGMHGQPGPQAQPGPAGLAQQHPGELQYPPLHPYWPQPQQPGYASYGSGYPPPWAAPATSGYPGGYAPYEHPGYAGYPGYPPRGYGQAHAVGAMPGQGAPIGAHPGAQGAGGVGFGGLGASNQPGAARGPGPQAGMQQLFDELAQGGNGLSSLTRMLSLDDTEFWKGALVGAAAVLLLTNDQVQDALFKTGAKAKSAVKSGADKLKERASGAAKTEDDT